MSRRKTRAEGIDYMLVAVVIALLAYGLLMLYSATFFVGVDYYFTRQLLWVGIGVIAFLVAYRIPYPFYRLFAVPAMLVTLALLTLVVVLGPVIFGAQRSLIEKSVQPGVLARLVAVIYIAAWLSSKGEQLNKIKYGLIPFAVIVGIVAFLIMLQPDVSTALLITLTGLAMFFFAGGDPFQLVSSLILGSGAGFLFAWYLLPTHSRARFNSYVAGLQDPQAMSYHLRMSLAALGDGGLFGRGIGSGYLKFGYLPAAHTDSIFAVLGQELGLMGTLLMIALFVLLAQRGYRIALETPDPFGSLVAFGVTTMVVSEAMLNVLVMVGLVPFTGTALPFFTYGGTGVMVTLAGMGLLLGISQGHPRGQTYESMVRSWRDGWTRLSRARRSAGAVHRRA